MYFPARKSSVIYCSSKKNNVQTLYHILHEFTHQTWQYFDRALPPPVRERKLTWPDKSHQKRAFELVTTLVKYILLFVRLAHKSRQSNLNFTFVALFLKADFDK